MKTSEILAKLKSMASKAGTVLYERIGLAALALGDKAWIDTEHAGDYDKALEWMQADMFPELGLAFGLRRLLTLREKFPAEEQWKRHRYNVVRLWAEYRETESTHNQGTQEPRRSAKVKDLEERDEKIKELEWVAKTAKDAAEKMETEVESLRRENGELRGELKALNRMLDQLRQGRVTA